MSRYKIMIISRGGQPTKRNTKSKAPVEAINRRYDGEASSDILSYNSSFTVLSLIVFMTMIDQDTIQTG